jgi:hypothetical protein
VAAQSYEWSIAARCFLALLAAIGLSGVISAGAHSAASVPVCRAVQVTGGDYNGMTGGVSVAHVFVKNAARRTCMVVGRPWIRLPRLLHPITITDLDTGALAGTPSGRVILWPGKRASAAILLNPGRCDRGRSIVFALTAHAGWKNGSAAVRGSMCNDGSGQIDVSTFRPG